MRSGEVGSLRCSGRPVELEAEGSQVQTWPPACALGNFRSIELQEWFTKVSMPYTALQPVMPFWLAL